MGGFHLAVRRSLRHGGKHDWYQNPRTHVSQPVPRHRELTEPLAKHIIKMLSDA
ncbi:MAG: type II toxin-antitoxin system HicA family toxin [Gammaproteobacteria bacterium]